MYPHYRLAQLSPDYFGDGSLRTVEKSAVSGDYWVMNIFRTSARVLVSLPFILDGLSALRDPDPHAEKVLRASNSLTKVGGPTVSDDEARLFSRAGGIITLGAGISLAFGKNTRLAGLTLAAATIPIALTNAPIWMAGDKAERREAGSKLIDYGALLGGLMFVTWDRGGLPSRKWKRHYRRQQRDAVRSAVEEARAVVHKARS